MDGLRAEEVKRLKDALPDTSGTSSSEPATTTTTAESTEHAEETTETSAEPTPSATADRDGHSEAEAEAEAEEVDDNASTHSSQFEDEDAMRGTTHVWRSCLTSHAHARMGCWGGT